MMKKFWITISAAVLCLLAVGCASSEKGGMGMPGKEVWSHELTTQTLEGDAKADDGRVLATYSYEKPVMTVSHEDGTPIESKGAASEAAAAFNGYFDEWLDHQKAWFDDLAASAKEEYALMEGEEFNPWEQTTDEGVKNYAYCDEVTTSFWENDRMATVTLQQYSFTGGVHGYGMRSGVSFDMQSGKHITPDDMMQDFDGLKTVVEQEILSQINAIIAQQGEGAYFSDYADTVKEWNSREIFFGDDGMTVVFAVYDIAPYAAGEQAFTIPYETIAPYLNDYGRELLGSTMDAGAKG